MTDLYRLSYVSHSRIPPEQRDAELAEILYHARQANHAAGISGVLIASGPYFCQMLEGSGTAVEQIFETIQLDSRHEAITVLEFVPVANRMLTGWDMACFDRDHDDDSIGQLRQLIEQLQVVATGRPILNVFDQLIQLRESQGNRSAA